MNITIFDFAIIVLPLVILLSALLSRVRASLSRQMDEVSEAKKALRPTHIEVLRAKANRNLIPAARLRGGSRIDPSSLIEQAT